MPAQTPHLLRLALKGAFTAAAALMGCLALSACAANTSAQPTSASTGSATAAASGATASASPDAAATALPSWARSMGISSPDANVTLTAPQTCRAVVSIFKAESPEPGKSTISLQYAQALVKDLALLRNHAAPETQPDLDAIIADGKYELSLGNPNDQSRTQDSSKHFDNVLKYCPGYKADQ